MARLDCSMAHTSPAATWTGGTIGVLHVPPAGSFRGCLPARALPARIMGLDKPELPSVASFVQAAGSPSLARRIEQADVDRGALPVQGAAAAKPNPTGGLEVSAAP